MSKPAPDAAVAKVRASFKRSGLTLAELGRKMGFPESMARMSAFQALKAADPRISTLRRFAKALGIPIEELVTEGNRGQVMASKEKQYRRVHRPRAGVDYSVVLNGVRQIVRLDTKLSHDDWVVKVKATGELWNINPKSLDTAEPT